MSQRTRFSVSQVQMRRPPWHDCGPLTRPPACQMNFRSRYVLNPRTVPREMFDLTRFDLQKYSPGTVLFVPWTVLTTVPRGHCPL